MPLSGGTGFARMNPSRPSHSAAHAHGPSLSLDDILFTLFRHKRLLVGFVFLALAGVVGVRLVRPPLFVSKAKLMVHYVMDARGVTPSNPEGQNVRPLDVGADAQIRTEIEILTSLDVVTQAVANVGPAKILARKGGGNDIMGAAGVVCSGLEVEPPRSSTLTVAFKHPDPDVVQPVLDAVIRTYMQKHVRVHLGVGELNQEYAHQKDELRAKLLRTEEELKKLKAEAKVYILEDAKRSYQEQVTKKQADLQQAEQDLAEHEAVLGNGNALPPGTLPGTGGGLVPYEKVNDYTDLISQLDALKKRERELLLAGYKEAFPLVQNVREQIRTLSEQKAKLETAHPALRSFALTSTRGGTNSFGVDATSELVEINRLKARVAACHSALSNIQAQANHMMDLEPKIAELERLRTEQQKSYDSAVASLEQTQKGEAPVNISIIQNPTPPGQDFKKLLKLVGIVIFGCVGMGLGLAFVIDLVLDRTIKRGLDVERVLGMPVMLTIPDLSGAARPAAGWLARWWQKKRNNGHTPDTEAQTGETWAVAPWQPSHQLHTYTEGLRERVMTYFEINNLNLKKPKLVAVTGCGEGSGVSTLASGLAASLSKTGDGNVLLVDMNGEHGAAHSFYQGQPGCGIADVLEPENRSEAMVQEKLYVASLEADRNDKLALALPKRFTHLVPKLKASDYDYIIFDMPPVSATSATPRLASHMDMVLLVLEAEKTGQHAAKRASTLMRESRSNVAAVLNKHREHMPTQLSQDL